jgi:starvation-inducible DNA-binding protein
MKPNIGLQGKSREGSAAVLNQLLADEYVLYTKTRNYHWNVTGPDFSELHKFFEAQYEEIDAIIDETAERARSLGGISLGSLKEFLKHTRLSETPGEKLAPKVMIGNLLADHETLIQGLRGSVVDTGDKYGDMGTQDFLTGIMEQHEKMAWMLRSYLE